MARYELGAVYKINVENRITFYVRLLELDCYGVFASLVGDLCEETFSVTPYQLYFTCNSFPVKRGIWEKVLPSPNSKGIELWNSPDLASYVNFNPDASFEQCRIYQKGNPYKCDKNLFISLVKYGMIENTFNNHEAIPSFLTRYYKNWPNSYILDKVHLQSGTKEYQKQKLKILNEMGLTQHL